MISKRFLLVLICSVVLLGAVAAYAYIQVSNNKNHTEIKTRTFNFEWLPYAQNVTPGKLLQMNLTFTLLEDKNLSIVVKVNDNINKSTFEYLGLAMDYPFYKVFRDCANAVVFLGYKISDYGGPYRAGQINDSGLILIWEGPQTRTPYSSDRYDVTYNEDEGYTFYILLPPPEEPLPSDWIHISYTVPIYYPTDPTSIFQGVYVRFHLDLLREWKA